MRRLTLLALGAALIAPGVSMAQDLKVRVMVDFGEGSRPPIRREVFLAPGATVVDATRAAASLEQGVVCCDPRDVAAIGGLHCDKRAHAFWLYWVDDKSGGVPAYQYKLKSGDRLVWRYRKVRF
ncbi:MAG TPA: DUF4430 domain-containing protein [bacterium]|nr:DUF4430 domain-containing protein [bacterium]